MLTKYEQTLIERFKKNGGVVNTEKFNSTFVFIIRPLTTPGVDRDRISSNFEDEVCAAIKNRDFSSAIYGLAIFPQICDPAIYSPLDYVTRKGKDGSVYAGINIDYKLWNNSTPMMRIELLRKNVVESIEKVSEKLLVSDDRAELLSVVNRVAETLTANEMKQSGSEQ